MKNYPIKFIKALVNYSPVIFIVFIIAYMVVLTLLTICYFLGLLSPQKIPHDWWTALGIVVTLTLAILIMNFFREKEFIDTRIKIDNFQKDINDAKQITVLTTTLIDIAKISKNSSGKWKDNFRTISDLYSSGFISDNDILKLSYEAWKLNDIVYVFKLRELSYNSDPKDTNNHLQLLSILPYVFSIGNDLSTIPEKYKMLYNDQKAFMDDVGLEKSSDNTIISRNFSNKHTEIKNGKERSAISLVGRYLFKQKNYSDSLCFFENAIKKRDGKNRWDLRYILKINLAKNDFINLEKNYNKACKSDEWKDDYIYFAFFSLIENILRISQEKEVKKVNKYLIVRAINDRNYDKMTMWNFTDILNNLDVDDKIKELIKKEYKIFYLFFGADDENFKSDYGIQSLEVERDVLFNKIFE